MQMYIYSIYEQYTLLQIHIYCILQAQRQFCFGYVVSSSLSVSHVHWHMLMYGTFADNMVKVQKFSVKFLVQYTEIKY